MIERDDHHPCHDRVSWDARPEGNFIRENTIARGMGRKAHELCHRECGPVPVPLYPSLQWIANRYHPEGDIFSRMGMLCTLLEGANRMKHAKPIEKEVNLLAIEALENQIPYIQDGLPSSTTYIDLADGVRKTL